MLAAVDLAAKALADARLTASGVDLGPVALRLAHNSGVAFSLGDALPSGIVLGFTGIVTVALVVVAWRRAPSASRLGRMAGAGILAGAVANLVDRAPDGVVTDYLHTGWWPTFNLADTFISVGFIVLMVSLWRDERRTDPQEPAAETEDPPAPRRRLLNPW